MRFSRNLLNLLIRVLLIVLFSVGMVYTFLETELQVTPYMFAGLLVITAIETTYRLNQQERTWTQFLNSIAFGDFNRAYQHKTSSLALQEAYQLITQQLEGLQTDKAAEFRLLQTVLGHIGVAVICFQKNGKVLFTNKAFQSLFELNQLLDVSHLKTKDESIYNMLISEKDTLPFWIDHKGDSKLLVKVEDLKLKGRALRLVSFSDIKTALEHKELSSYQKLLKVMTHEIMNSTAPILSLIRVVNKKLVKADQLQLLNEKDQKNTAKSLQIIEERTDGIMSFVSAYKKINQPITLNKEPVSSNELIDSVKHLIHVPEHVDFSTENSYGGQIEIDRALFTQVLINLLKNGTEALIATEKAELSLAIKSKDARIQITISDNGLGISEDKLENLFVPFFTTKKEGSGVGLAFSKKVVIAHAGTIVYHRENGYSHFIITLEKNKA